MLATLNWEAPLHEEDPFKYVEKLEFFKEQKELEFKPGLNILFGKNGSGKSSVLKVLAQKLFALQGGISALTLYAVRESRFDIGDEGLSLAPYVVSHDGTSIVFIDTRATPGIIGGQFDDDFFEEGVRNAMLKKNSTGEATLSRLNTFVGVCLALIRGQEVDIEAVYPAEVQNDLVGQHFRDKWVSMIAPTIARGQRTVLIDEPESGLSLVLQKRLWTIFQHEKVTEKFQIVVATHSVFALNVKNAHFIEMSSGYINESKEALKSAFNA